MLRLIKKKIKNQRFFVSVKVHEHIFTWKNAQPCKHHFTVSSSSFSKISGNLYFDHLQVCFPQKLETSCKTKSTYLQVSGGRADSVLNILHISFYYVNPSSVGYLNRSANCAIVMYLLNSLRDYSMALFTGHKLRVIIWMTLPESMKYIKKFGCCVFGPAGLERFISHY